MLPRHVAVLTLGLFWALVVALPTGAPAQQPGRPVDPREFARPKPLCTLSDSDSRAALERLRQALDGQRFEIEQVDLDAGEIHGKRADGTSLDRVILWLERNFQKPDGGFHVFILYGRFDRFFGATNLQRVVADAPFEDSRIGALKQDIIRRALGG
jgi:hypothetical protein